MLSSIACQPVNNLRLGGIHALGHHCPDDRRNARPGSGNVRPGPRRPHRSRRRRHDRRHVHTLGVQRYKNVLLVNSGTWQDQTEFQKRVNLAPVPARVPIVDLENFDVKILAFD